MKLLDSSTRSGLVKLRRKASKIVIGAPHHAIGGIKNLPCPEHQVSDENTGYIAKDLANYINCSYIVGCNAKIDYNKSSDNSYYKYIEELAPKLLIEIHGHGGKKVGNKRIEISCGRIDNNEFSIKFATLLSDKINANLNFQEIEIEGDLNKIYYKASKTFSIKNKNWDSLHIEFPPFIRVDHSNQKLLPEYHKEFVAMLGDSILDLLEK